MINKVAILGAGPGGYTAAIRAAQLGADVTIIEQDHVGGTCLNWGCIPSKILKSSAEHLKNFQQAALFGIQADSQPTVNLEALSIRKNQIIHNQRTGIKALFQKHKIQHLHGTGRIQTKGIIEISDGESSLQHITYDRLIIATGSHPLEFSKFPFDGKRILSSNEALYLKDIPKSLLIVGGGVIGCEFACIFSDFGSEVTVVEALDRLLPLPEVDADCSKVLAREMKKRKITIYLNHFVDAIERSNQGLDVRISPFHQNGASGGKKSLIINVEQTVICIGRRASTADIGLENIGVSTDEKGWIIVDDQLQTNIDGVFAIGDVLGPKKIMLAHVASFEGMMAAENALGDSRQMDYTVVPGAIFSTPEVGYVGLSEKIARKTSSSVRSDAVLLRSIGKAHVINETAGLVKIVSNPDFGRILGVHIIGPHASDLISEGTLAIKHGLTVRQLAETIHAHPTLAEVMMEAGLKALDRGLHS